MRGGAGRWKKAVELLALRIKPHMTQVIISPLFFFLSALASNPFLFFLLSLVLFLLFHLISIQLLFHHQIEKNIFLSQTEN